MSELSFPALEVGCLPAARRTIPQLAELSHRFPEPQPDRLLRRKLFLTVSSILIILFRLLKDHT